MQILLADAKTMSPTGRRSESVPLFRETARLLARDLASYTADELVELFRCSPAVARETRERFRDFATAEADPALFAFTGQAYRHLRAETLDEQALAFGQSHLFITSFLYGLLRPLDGIAPYRMEHYLSLPSSGGVPMDRFWRERLTEPLLEAVREDDGTLLHLSTGEYEELFDWGRVTAEARVVAPRFLVRKEGALKVQAVWAKSCRGAMARHILEQRVGDPEAMQGFSYCGFSYAPELGDPLHPHFVRDDDR